MPQPGSAQYEALLGRIYDAALVPGGWDQALAAVISAVGGAGGALVFQDRSGPTLDTEVTSMIGYGAEAPALYTTHFATQDDRLGQVLEAPPGYVLADQWNIDHAAFRKTQLCNEFFRRFGFDCGMAVGLFGHGSRTGVVSSYRGIGDGPFSAGQIDLLTALSPHLTRALQVTRQLSKSEARATAFATGLDRFSQGVLLLDEDGRVLEMNAAAEATLGRPGCPLTVRERRLLTRQPGDAAALRRTIEEASIRAEAPGTAPPAVLRLRSRNGTVSLGLMAVPVRRADRLGLSQDTGTLVFIADPAATGAIDPAVLAQQFGLSASEAEVAAALATGDSIAGIADRRQVSRETVRVQVKHVLAKTGLNSQGRLVALATRSLAGLRRV